MASRIATEQTAEMLEARLGLGPPVQGLLAGMHATMFESVTLAHQAIREECAQDDELEGRVTTLTAMALDLDRDEYVLRHVVDSRAYCLRADVLGELTQDDT